MFMYLPQIRIDKEDEKKYKAYLSSKGIFKARKIFCYHIKQILINYFKLTKEQKLKSYICIYYNAADFPILTIRF